VTFVLFLWPYCLKCWALLFPYFFIGHWSACVSSKDFIHDSLSGAYCCHYKVDLLEIWFAFFFEWPASALLLFPFGAEVLYILLDFLQERWAINAVNLKEKCIENAVCTLWKRHEHTTATTCNKSIMDPIKTLWECRVGAVWMLWERCVLLANLISLGVFRSEPTACWHVFRQTLWHRCLVWQGLKMHHRCSTIQFFQASKTPDLPSQDSLYILCPTKWLKRYHMYGLSAR